MADDGGPATVKQKAETTLEIKTWNHWSRSERQKWIVALMSGTAILYAGRTIMPVCIAVIAEEKEWDKTESGTVLSSFFWGYTMTQFFGGYMSDRVGGERVLLVAACLWSTLTFFTPLIIQMILDKYTTMYVVVVARVLLGFSQGVHFPGLTSIISRKVNDQERSLTFSMISAGANCGTLLSGSIGSYLMENFGWETPFYVFGFGGLLWVLIIHWWMKRKNETFQVKEKAKSLFVGVHCSAKGSTQTKSNEAVPWLVLLSKSGFWSLLVANYCQNNAFYILLSWLPTFFHENFPDEKSWVFNVVPWLVIVPCNIGCGWLADRLIKGGYSVTSVRKFLATVLFCGTAVFLSFISAMETYYSTLICMTLAIACCGFYSSSLAINPMDIAPLHAGAVFGIMNMTSAIPGFVGVYMAGYILETTKSWNAVFSQTAGICIFGWLVFTALGTGRNII